VEAILGHSRWPAPSGAFPGPTVWRRIIRPAPLYDKSLLQTLRRLHCSMEARLAD